MCLNCGKKYNSYVMFSGNEASHKRFPAKIGTTLFLIQITVFVEMEGICVKLQF